MASDPGDLEDSSGFLQAIRESEKVLQRHPDDPTDVPGLHAALAASVASSDIIDLGREDSLGLDSDDDE